MKVQFLFFIVVSMILFSCSDSSDFDNFEGIRTVLAEQQDAWNNGDIEKFMKGYHKTPDLRFMSSGNINKGWQNTLERYLRTYPDTETMGILKFEILDIYPIENNSAGLYGTYHLARTNDDPRGYFNLIFKKIKGEWKIISDMTCASN